LKINRAIVSTDDNPLYYEFWPLVASAWNNFGIKATVAVVGNLNLDHSFGSIIKVPVIEGIPSGFIAQVIRFIIPCLFPEEVSIIGDIDMVPLQKKYFTTKITSYSNENIIIFSADAYKSELRYPMCYIAAKGKYFQEIIGLKSTDYPSIRSFIIQLHALNLNWETDELYFAKCLSLSPLIDQTIFLKRGGWHPFASNRIDRDNWKYSLLSFFFNRYIDSHSLRPYSSNIHRLRHIDAYVRHWSDGRKYLFYLLKKPVRRILNSFLWLKQYFLGNSLFEIKEIKGLNAGSRKVISFSLYGSSPRYTQNIRKIIRSYKKLYPDWKCRIYAGLDVSVETTTILLDENCELFIMRKTGVDARYMFWRFLALDDKTAESIIFRDIDSFALAREKVMVDQWMSSDKQYHIIRDHIYHTAKIMGGLWGVKNHKINIKKESKKMLLNNKYGIDQHFLEKYIHPRIKNNVMVHDSFPRFPDEDPIVIPFENVNNFIGEINTVEGLDYQEQVGSYYENCFVLK
jgi:hypothetical protein